MKVMLVNGSPHQDGCTNRALEEGDPVEAMRLRDLNQPDSIGRHARMSSNACWIADHSFCLGITKPKPLPARLAHSAPIRRFST